MVSVRKLNGATEQYDERKLRFSLERAGADRTTIQHILAAIPSILHEGISTKELYDFALRGFRQFQPHLASRYTLKEAILRLGPAGFPFEAFAAHIFEKKGYVTQLDQYVQGTFIEHEIDIIAAKEQERIMVECKHHIKPWDGCNIQTALYVYARFLDVQKSFTTPMLITNTKFSPQILQYAKGVGLGLMGWRYPLNDSLEQNIEQFNLYPVTILHSLDSTALRAMLHDNLVLISSIAEMSINDLASYHLSPARAEQVVAEARALCGSPPGRYP